MAKNVSFFNKSMFTSTGLRWLWLAVIVFIIGLSSNYIISENLSPIDIVQIMPYLNLRYVRNYGVAFGFFADSNASWLHWFFISVSISICIILLIFMYCTKVTKKLNNIVYALIIGGALSNLFERLQYGFVIDIIDFHINNWHFATFNFADSAICIGVTLIVMKEFS